MKRKIAIFLHNPIAERACVIGMTEALSSDYSIKIFNKDEVESSLFRKMDIVAFPGGKGDADNFDVLFKDTKDRVQEYVDRGGRYLGICMGAYWADRYYFDLLSDIDCVQYIKRKTSEIKRSYPTVIDVNWQGSKEEMFFFDGATFMGKRRNFKVYAEYSNGDPMAIFQKRIGLIGCHPESKKSWYLPYIKNKWHNYHHHKLLLDFVNELYER